jgi:hypothetical protein
MKRGALRETDVSVKMAWPLGFVCHKSALESQAIDGIIRFIDSQRKSALEYFQFERTMVLWGQTRMAPSSPTTLLLPPKSMSINAQYPHERPSSFGGQVGLNDELVQGSANQRGPLEWNALLSGASVGSSDGENTKIHFLFAPRSKTRKVTLLAHRIQWRF